MKKEIAEKIKDKITGIGSRAAARREYQKKYQRKRKDGSWERCHEWTSHAESPTKIDSRGAHSRIDSYFNKK